MTPPDSDAGVIEARIIGNRYRLLEELGRGGMARVHRAHDVVLDRDVAVKLLHPHLAEDPAFTARFLREGRAAAQLAHPALVAVHDAVEAGADTCLVMELVSATTLRDVLTTRGRLNPSEVLSLLGPAARGLAAVHAAGIVHRDVKPENVLITEDGQVKVSDFGLARLAAEVDHTMTATSIVGSPHYLAPEIVRGTPFDARADVYALGVLLFECLTGRPPFDGDTPLATATMHTTDRVPPPSTVVPGLSSALDELVLRCTDHDPGARPADAQEFVDALVAAVPEGPTVVDLRDGQRHTVVLPLSTAETVISTRPRAVEAVAATPRRRRRWVRLLLVLVVLGGLAGGGWYAYDQVLAPVTPVPDVVGTPLDDAIPRIVGAGFGFEEADGPRPFDRDVASGAVLRVVPGDEARKGSTLVVVVSNGPEQLVVPDVAGAEVADAVATLRDVGFEVDVVESYDPVAAPGTVVATVPAGDEVHGDGQTVQVVASLGREPATVPDVDGLDEGTALAELRAAGFDAAVGELVHDNTVPEGAVVTTIPSSGTEAFVGDTVEVVVSRGPAPFALPSMVGRTLADARSRLQQLGLQVAVQRVPTEFQDREGRVDSQTPGAGQEVRRGDEVTLYVWD